MSAVQGEAVVVQNTSNPITLDAFNYLVAELLTLGDKLNAAATKIHEQARHVTVVVGVIITMTVMHLLVFKWLPTTIPALLVEIVAVWIAYHMMDRFLQYLDADDDGHVAIRVLSKSTLFVYISTRLQLEYTVFVKLLELTRTSAESLYQSGKLSELRWQTVKLHLARYGI